MIYLLDTSGLVRLLGDPALQQAWYDAVDAEAIGSCYPQRTEFLYSARDRSEYDEITEMFGDLFPDVSVPKNDAYRGCRVRLSADVKTADATKKAGLYLRVIDPARTKPPEIREQLSLPGTADWTRQHIEAAVPADSVYVLFGISLTGPGQIWATNVQVEPA